MRDNEGEKEGEREKENEVRGPEGRRRAPSSASGNDHCIRVGVFSDILTERPSPPPRVTPFRSSRTTPRCRVRSRSVSPSVERASLFLSHPLPPPSRPVAVPSCQLFPSSSRSLTHSFLSPCRTRTHTHTHTHAYSFYRTLLPHETLAQRWAHSHAGVSITEKSPRVHSAYKMDFAVRSLTRTRMLPTYLR